MCHRFTKNLEEYMQGEDHEGTRLGRFFYQDVNFEELPCSQETSRVMQSNQLHRINKGINETYSDEQLDFLIDHHNDTILKEFVNKDTTTNKKLDKVQITRLKNALTISGKHDPQMNMELIMKHLKRNERKPVKTTLIISDWRLMHLNENCLLNSVVLYWPSHIGEKMFDNLENFICTHLKNKDLDFRHIVFAFGGHSSFEYSFIEIFIENLIDVIKEDKLNTQVHWLSNLWNGSEATLTGHPTGGRDEKQLNRQIVGFVRKMKQENTTCFHYHYIHYPWPPKEDQIEFIKDTQTIVLEPIYKMYITYFVENCGVVLSPGWNLLLA